MLSEEVGDTSLRRVTPGSGKGLTETWAMVEAKRARTAETPKPPSFNLRSRALYFYPTNTYPFHQLRAVGSIQYYSCFISYSHDDKTFARRLHDQLRGQGIRCWLDEKQLLPGDDIYAQVDRGIRLWDKVLLCCSEASLTSLSVAPRRAAPSRACCRSCCSSRRAATGSGAEK